MCVCGGGGGVCVSYWLIILEYFFATKLHMYVEIRKKISSRLTVLTIIIMVQLIETIYMILTCKK